MGRLPRPVLGTLGMQRLVRLTISLWGATPPAPIAQARSLRPERVVALLQGSGVARTVSWGGFPVTSASLGGKRPGSKGLGGGCVQLSHSTQPPTREAFCRAQAPSTL